MEDKFPIGTKVVLKLPSDHQKSERVYYLLDKTGATFSNKVYGVVRSKNSNGTYSVEWTKYNPDKTLENMYESEMVKILEQGPEQGPEQDGGKRARKSRKSRKVRKSHKKYRKSRKVRKSHRRRARR
jgi:hypothetical protein